MKRRDQPWAGPPVFILLAAKDEAAGVECFCLVIEGIEGLHAGNAMRTIMEQFGGKGGGNSRFAEGSLPFGATTKAP